MTLTLFFFNDTATTEIYTLSLHDALPIFRAQRVQRDAALAIPFHACDLGAAEASRAIDANAARTEPHCGLHRPLHGTAEGDPALKLLGDRFGNELSVELRFANLDDVHHDVRV